MGRLFLSPGFAPVGRALTYCRRKTHNEFIRMPIQKAIPLFYSANVRIVKRIENAVVSAAVGKILKDKENNNGKC